MLKIQALSSQNSVKRHWLLTEKIPRCLLRETNTGFVFCDNFYLSMNMETEYE